MLWSTPLEGGCKPQWKDTSPLLQALVSCLCVSVLGLPPLCTSPPPHACDRISTSHLRIPVSCSQEGLLCWNLEACYCPLRGTSSSTLSSPGTHSRTLALSPGLRRITTLLTHIIPKLSFTVSNLFLNAEGVRGCVLVFCLVLYIRPFGESIRSLLPFQPRWHQIPPRILQTTPHPGPALTLSGPMACLMTLLSP